MDNLLQSIGDIESVQVLFALLPGLLTVLVVRSLAAREQKLEAVETVIRGLAFTLLVHAIWALLTIGSIIPTPDIIGMPLCAVALGLIVATIINSGWMYEILRFSRLTSESSWGNAWKSSFRHAAKNVGEYAVLHLKDKRRILGAVRCYSADADGGHVAIDKAAWLSQSNEVKDAIGFLIFPVEEIKFIQFLESQGEPNERRPGIHGSGPTRKRGKEQLESTGEDTSSSSATSATATTKGK